MNFKILSENHLCIINRPFRIDAFHKSSYQYSLAVESEPLTPALKSLSDYVISGRIR